jgi:RND family efflux transporter MFP subunit
MPEINRFRLRSRQFIGAAFLLAMLTSGCGSGNPPAGASGFPPLPVRVQRVESGTVEEASEFVGTLEASDIVDLRPEIQGRIVEIYVSEGAEVTAGSPVIQLRPDRSQAQVSSAIASVDAARSALSTAEAELRASQAERASALADLDLAQSDFERSERLTQEGAQSQQDLDRARRDLNAANATLQATEDRVEAAQARVAQERAAYERAQADVRVVQEDAQFNRVTAPIAGMVGDIQVKVGDYVDIGQSLTRIVQNDTLDLRISIPSTRSSQLRMGLPVELSDPNQGTPLARGQVSFISPSVDSSAQAILAKATFTNTGNLRDGQYVSARVIWDEGPGLLVPTTAISRLGGQNFVFVIEEETTDEGEIQYVAHQRPVELGPIQDNNYQVLDGIEAGDQIAVSNVLRLQDGAPIQPES